MYFKIKFNELSFHIFTLHINNKATVPILSTSNRIKAFVMVFFYRVRVLRIFFQEPWFINFTQYFYKWNMHPWMCITYNSPDFFGPGLYNKLAMNLQNITKWIHSWSRIFLFHRIFFHFLIVMFLYCPCIILLLIFRLSNTFFLTIHN